MKSFPAFCKGSSLRGSLVDWKMGVVFLTIKLAAKDLAMTNDPVQNFVSN
jgi:hypothetical protein